MTTVQIYDSKVFECPNCNVKLGSLLFESSEDRTRFEFIMENLTHFLKMVPNEIDFKGIDVDRIAQIATKQFGNLMKVHEEDKILSELRNEKNQLEKDIIKIKNSNKTIQKELESLRSKSYYIGEEQEVDLAKQLQSVAQGTLDKIIVNDVSNNEDILIEVRDSENLLGKIVIESKNVKNWQNKFLSQTKKEMKKTNAMFGIIASTKLPKNALSKNIYMEDSIWITKPEYVSISYKALRHIISEASKQNLGKEKLLDLIKSDVFISRLQTIIDKTSDIRNNKNTATKQLSKTLSRFDSLADDIDLESGLLMESILKIKSGGDEK